MRCFWVKNLIYRIKKIYYLLFDKFSLTNLLTTPIIPRGIVRKNLLPNQPVRFLEIGPRWGQDSRDWDKRIKIKEMVFIDLPQQADNISLWIDEIETPHRVIYADVMKMSEKQRKEIGQFDVVYCSGVLYHIDEQFRFCEILSDFVNIGGLLILESYVLDTKKNIIKIFWPEQAPKSQNHHIPSRTAIKSWLEMTGFSHVIIHDDIYPKRFRKRRTVLTAINQGTKYNYSYFKSDSNIKHIPINFLE